MGRGEGSVGSLTIGGIGQSVRSCTGMSNPPRGPLGSDYLRSLNSIELMLIS